MNARTIFKIVAIVGVPVTGYLSARGAMTKAEYIKKNGTPQTKKEKVKDNVRAYWPAAVSGAATVCSILMTDSLAAKEIAVATGLATAAVAKKDVIKGQFEKYREVVKEDAGAEKDIQYMTKTAEVELDDEGEALHWFEIYWLDNNVIRFQSTMSQVKDGLNDINRQLIDYITGTGIVTVSEALRYFDHPELATPWTDKAGWSYDLLNVNCDCYYLDFYVYPADERIGSHGDDPYNTFVIDTRWPPEEDLAKSFADAEKSGVV